MEFNDIAIFSVSRIISERISTLLVEKNIDIPIYELEHYDVIAEAQKLVTSGVKVIISRGGTAGVLRRCVDIPIVEIAHDFYGIHKTVEEAKRYSKKIVAVGFPQYCNMLRHYQSMTNDNFKICQVYNHKDIEAVMPQLKADGFDVVMGGLTVNQYAMLHDMHVVMGDTDNLSIDIALNQAINILKSIKKEAFKYTVVDSALNLTSDSIICFDGRGQILNCNIQAENNFGLSRSDNIFRIGAFKSIHEHIINEDNIKSIIIEWDKKYFDVSLKHIYSKEEYFSILNIDVINVANSGGISSEKNKKSFPTRYSFLDILGSSHTIKECIKSAEKYSQNDLPVYIEGETGTGKELFAQSIHNASARSSKPFIALNCAAIPETLLESELFGYEEGVFTGAKKGGKIGLFELVDGGTIFLDEVSEIPLLVQLKLLRVLQERAFSRVGGTSLISTDFRLITASNKPLKQMVIDEKFRGDFFYRLNVLKLNVPNLHERGLDIITLAEQLIKSNDKSLMFTDDAVNFMLQYNWPGNVRELQSLIYRLIVLCDSDMVDVNDLLIHGEFFGNEVTMNHDNGSLLENNEKATIIRVLSEAHGDKLEAAKILGISSTTLWRRIKKYEIEI